MLRTLYHIGSYLFLIALAAGALAVLGASFPQQTGYRLLAVESGSMTPAIPVGAVIFIRLAEQYREGDIITYQRPGEKLPTTHRIVALRAEEGVLVYDVRGDANNANDPRPVAASDVLGKVVLSVPYLGYAFVFLQQLLH